MGDLSAFLVTSSSNSKLFILGHELSVNSKNFVGYQYLVSKSNVYTNNTHA